MNHVTRMLEGLSEKELYRQTLACIDAALHWTNEDTALFVLHVTVGEFKKLTGFYASRKVVKYLIDAYVGRFTRFYCTAHPLAIQDVADVFLQAYPGKLCLGCTLSISKGGAGLKHCAHNVNVSEIDAAKVEARVVADIQASIRGLKI